MSIEIEVTRREQVTVTHILVDAAPRYWDDAQVNGVEDFDGSLIPFREGDAWRPVINLESGRIANWPAGKAASIHYKICDQGIYWLLDENRMAVAKYRSDYVPDLLSVGEAGYGDYIIMEVDEDGRIKGWSVPALDSDEWEAA